MQLPLANHLSLASSSQQVLTRRLLPLYIAAFSQGLVLWAPIEKVFLKSLGFDQATLGLMAACYASLIPLLDLTSGILADRWSRKGVLILASVASMLNALLGGLSHDVPTYLVSTLFFGVEVALVSGTYESIVYDTLLEEIGESHAFERRLGQVKLLNSLALIIGSLTGGMVATVLSPRLTYFATIPLVAISLGALLTFKEPHLHHSEWRTPLSSHLWANSHTIFLPGHTITLVTIFSRVGVGSSSGVVPLSSIAFLLFALIFGGVSQHVGIFHAGWLVVGVTLLVSALLVKVALGQDFQGQEASDEPSSSGAA